MLLTRVLCNWGGLLVKYINSILHMTLSLKCIDVNADILPKTRKSSEVCHLSFLEGLEIKPVSQQSRPVSNATSFLLVFSVLLLLLAPP